MAFNIENFRSEAEQASLSDARVREYARTIELFFSPPCPPFPFTIKLTWHVRSVLLPFSAYVGHRHVIVQY